MNEIVGGTLKAINDKQSRADSIRNKRWDGLQEVIETTTQTFKKVARKSSLLASAPARMNRRGSLPGTEPSSRISQSLKRRDSMFGAACSNSVYAEGSTSEPGPCTSKRRNSLFGGQPASSVGMTSRGSLSGGSNKTGRRSSFLGSQPTASTKRRGSVSTSLKHTKSIDAQPRRNSMFGAQPLSYDDARISGARTA
jgi:hypothetical protein